MRRHLLLLIFSTLLPLAARATGKAAHHFNQVYFSPTTPLRVGSGQGVSAPFVGTANDFILVAGGCNFPGTAAADGGKKQFYRQVYIRKKQAHDGVWAMAGLLPRPLAYGASVTTPEGVVCIGGTSNGKTSEKSVLLLQLKQQRLQIKMLSPLPCGLDQHAAALGGGYLYVAGGQTGGIPSAKAFRIALSTLLKNPHAQWERLPDYTLPGNERVQPCGAVQTGALHPQFYLFGGYNPTNGKVFTDGRYLNPKNNIWYKTADIKPDGRMRALIGTQAVASGCSHILFFGGVDKDIFEKAIGRTLRMGELKAKNMSAAEADSLKKQQEAYMRQPAPWYRFNSDVLTYHTITDSWGIATSSPLMARAGAGIVPYTDLQGQQHWMVIDGEVKPGIRTADVTDVKMTYTAHFGWINWAVLIAYLIGMLLLGYYFMRREHSSEDFFKGGGRIPWWAAGISIFATMLSAITYMSIPAKAYATDWTYYPMQILILVVSFPVIKYYLPFFRRLNVTTAYEYLEYRFNYLTRLMASLLFIIFMVARMALVLFLPSLAMSAVTGINIFACIMLMAVITIVYCTMGGVEAVVWSDVVQGIILVGGAFLAAAYLIGNTTGGTTGFLTIAFDNDKFRLFDWSLDYRSATFWVVILGGIANNLISYTSDQTVIQRYLTTKDERSAARGILTNGVMSVFVTIAFFTIGTGLYTFFKTHPESMDLTMQKADAIFPFFMMSQLPVGIAGLLIAAVFAATMSTISSNINSISTAFTVDIYKRIRPSLSDKGTVRTARLTGVVSGIIGMLIAILMALVHIQSLLDYFNTILGLLSGGIGGLFLMGIFFPRIGAKAALTGFVCGTLTVFYMHFYTPVNFLLFGFVSIAVALLVGLLISLFVHEDKPRQGLTWQTLKAKEEEEE